MKSVSASVSKGILVVMLSVLVFLFVGCSNEQMGESTAQGDTRHQRSVYIDQQQLMADADKVMLFDEPGRLTGKRIPWYAEHGSEGA